jgi:hypothetical protein
MFGIDGRIKVENPEASVLASDAVMKHNRQFVGRDS